VEGRGGLRRGWKRKGKTLLLGRYNLWFDVDKGYRFGTNFGGVTVSILALANLPRHMKL
jgi:hypothetical protein